jgi:hypothetical protein
MLFLSSSPPLLRLCRNPPCAAQPVDQQDLHQHLHDSSMHTLSPLAASLMEARSEMKHVRVVQCLVHNTVTGNQGFIIPCTEKTTFILFADAEAIDQRHKAQHAGKLCVRLDMLLQCFQPLLAATGDLVL